MPAFTKKYGPVADPLSLELLPFDLSLPQDWMLFYNLCCDYYREVCSPEECREELEDLQDQTLTAQLIAQTRRKKDPYFVMEILYNTHPAGFLSFSFWEKPRSGFINNLYITPPFRNRGLGSSVMDRVEETLAGLGAQSVELIPVDRARPFYQRRGFAPLRVTAQGEQIYGKTLRS